MRKAFYLILILGLITSSHRDIWAVSSDKVEEDIVRVSVADNKNSIHLVLKGSYKIYALNSKRVLEEGPRLRAYVKGAPEGGLKIGKKEIKVSGVKIKVSGDSNLYVDGRNFRGEIDIIRREGLKLAVINHIGLDDYLCGVLYHEVSHRWPMEAIKAQAIAARTFALYHARQNKLQDYDLRSDIYSQVYGGRVSEKWATNKAVDLTKGKVLGYNGDIFPTYYHATCAGRTEDASNLWNINLPTLKGTACDFCKKSPHYHWTKEISLWKLEEILKDNGYDVRDISTFTILSKNPSGRVEKIEIKDGLGTSVIMTGKDFRQTLGPNEVRSTKFDAEIKWHKLILKGAGWGHGVGMCQWGAYGMAKKGRSAEEILKYYYPGTEVTTIDKL